jgi:hypothetical protein
MQADGNRLVDQNGQDVWYDVKLNRTYYDYVVNNGFRRVYCSRVSLRSPARPASIAGRSL